MRALRNIALILACLGLLLAGTKARAGGLEIGQAVPDFTLATSAGQPFSLGESLDRGHTVVMFIATRCPFSNAYNKIMAGLAARYQGKKVTFVGINSNLTEPAAEVARHAKENGFGFPVLKDPGHKVADAWQAQVTPEVFVIGPGRKLLYNGALGNAKAPTRSAADATSADLDRALEDLLAGKAASRPETKAFGCSIKRGAR